jgi:hypothetical protein
MYSALLNVPQGSDISMQIWLSDYQASLTASGLSSSWMLSTNLLADLRASMAATRISKVNGP